MQPLHCKVLNLVRSKSRDLDELEWYHEANLRLYGDEGFIYLVKSEK